VRKTHHRLPCRAYALWAAVAEQKQKKKKKKKKKKSDDVWTYIIVRKAAKFGQRDQSGVVAGM